jgi:hypothetical protein
MTGLLTGLFLANAIHAEDKVMHLTAQDYADILQLYASYATAIDTREEGGMVWARKFTADGEFRTGQIKATGHKELADMNRRDGKPSPYPTHFTTNIAVAPAPGGARGTAYLLTTGNDANKRATVGSPSVYQDVLVKTPDGWRFKQRTLAQGSMPEGETGLAPLVGFQKSHTAGKTLTNEDRAEIQQLYARYATAIDTHAESGMLWARMFTPDGEFEVAGNRTVGHEKLAAMMRGDNGKPNAFPTHFTTNITVDASPEGARGGAYLLIVGKGADGKFAATSVAVYDDVLVRTSEGWRFKKRTLYQNSMKQPAK